MPKFWPWLLFFACAAFAGYGLRPLGEPDEGRYAECAREMLVSGDWLVPQLQGEPHLTKPPMTYWLMAGSMKLLGVNEWGARFPGALAFFLTILCVMELARTWGLGEAAARGAGLVFATALLPFLAGHLATTDMILTFWETLGILALWKVWRGTPLAGLWLWAFWLAFAGAFLTKGPPGWLPLLAMAVFVAVAEDFRPRQRVLWTASAFLPVLLFIEVSLVWYLAIIHRDPKMLGYFLGNEVVGRVLSNVHGRDKAWWFYPVTLALGLAPWVFLWPALLRRAYQTLKPGPAGEGIWARLRRIEDIRLFSILWFCVPLAVFLVAKSKMFLYLVPLFVPLALWSGRLLARWQPVLLPPGSHRRIWAWLGAGAWCVAALGFAAFPEIPEYTNSFRGLARTLRAASRQSGELVLYTIEDARNSISFYLGIPLVRLDESAREVLDYLRRRQARDGERPGLLVIKDTWEKKLSDKNYRIIAEDGQVKVLEVGPAPVKAAADTPSSRPDPQFPIIPLNHHLTTSNNQQTFNIKH